MYVKGEEGNSELEYAFLSWPGSLQPGSDCCLPLRGGGCLCAGAALQIGRTSNFAMLSLRQR